MKFGFGSTSQKSASDAAQESQNSSAEESPATSVEGSTTESASTTRPRGSATTPKKGRPTPTRREAERARGVHTGPVTPPLTSKEARAKRKADKASMTKEERKMARARVSAARDERRQLMLNGDDRYVLERDRGPQRRYARDWVDTHRRLSNYFMPVALFVIVAQFLVRDPAQVGLFSTAFLVVIALVLLDTVLVGVVVNKAVRERFGEQANTGFGLGFYAAMRAMQPRTLRTPRARVRPGDPIPGS